MQTTYENATIDAFLEELSSDAPAPGGGSVAALCGAMAASLVLMVCNLTVDKAKFAQNRRGVEDIIEEAVKLRQKLVKAVDRDIEAYQAVIACYRLSKGTEREKVQRREKIQCALKNATEVPYCTAEACHGVLELNRRLSRIGNPNAISDVAVSTHLAEAALQSALYNVDINCNYIQDEAYTSDYRKKRDELTAQALDLKQRIIDVVQTVLQS